MQQLLQVSSLRIDRQAVHLSAKGSKMGVAKSYNFDGAYDEETTQSDFFAEVGKPIVEEVLKGFNCTIFAYGQTGTGKTFTMEGLKDEATGAGCAPGTKGAGIIPRAVEQIFADLQALGIEYTVRVCAMELYNEELSDLIATGDDNKEIKLVTDPKKGLVIQVSPLATLKLFFLL
jgi:kinesin family protein 11